MHCWDRLGAVLYYIAGIDLVQNYDLIKLLELVII